jgi:Trk K+ transport system NAD-binding subunit
MKPDIDVVVRIFDDGFAELLQKQFGFRALSATGMAAPIFAASAANVDMTPPVMIEGKPHLLARLIIAPKSPMAGLSVNQVEEKFHTSLVLLARGGVQNFHPAGSMTIQHGDSLAFFGTPEDIRILIHENR